MEDNPLGDYSPAKPFKVARKRKKATITAIIPTEREEQITLHDFCKANRLLSWATPNGGSRNKLEAINLKKEGATAGVSDYIVMLPKVILFIEMKRRKRKLRNGKYSVTHTPTTDAQTAFIERANVYPYSMAKVCYGAEEAISFIKSAML